MDIGIQIGSRYFDSFQRIGREGFAEGFLHVGYAKYARPSPGRGDAHAAGAFGHEHAHHGVARGRVLEFHVAGAFRYRKGNRSDDLARLERSLVHACEKLVGGDLALAGDDGCTQSDKRRGIIRRGIVVGDRAADRAHVAHHRVADAVGEQRQCRNGFRDLFRSSNRRMRGHRADCDVAALDLDPAQFCDASQVDDVRRCGQAHLHGRDQRLTAGQQAGIIRSGQLRRRVRDTRCLVVIKCMHVLIPYLNGDA